MQTHIAKSLQTRCKAIQNADVAYNSAALALNPPRPTLNWSKASHYSFLEDFELLRDPWNDICNKPWATPVVRAVMKQALHIQRAHEKVENCNIEVCRLHMHILHESANLQRIVHSLEEQRDPITGAVNDYTVWRLHTNEQLLAHIKQIHSLQGFTGSIIPGIHAGQPPPGPLNTAKEGLHPIDSDEDDDESGAAKELEDEEEMQGQYSGLVDFVSNMSLHV